jgi:hypothetical protein
MQSQMVAEQDPEFQVGYVGFWNLFWGVALALAWLGLVLTGVSWSY